MNLMHIRERASALHLGELNDSDYLQEIVDFIVDNRNQLPEDVSHSLREAFGKQSVQIQPVQRQPVQRQPVQRQPVQRQPVQRQIALRNRQDAMNRVRRVQLEDLKTPEYLSDVIPLYGEKGDLFWTGELSSSTKRVFRNVLCDLYYANKRRNTANSVRRAFYCVALYRVIQRIMELHKSKSFTSNIASFCADMILKDSDAEEPQKSNEIADELKNDYKIGKVYEPYAQKGGTGIMFYLFVLPSYLYEKYLNKSDDVQTVLDHYESIGFKQDDSTKSAAASIMGFMIGRFDAQVSLFKPCTPLQVLTFTRKRGSYNEKSTQPNSLTKKAKTNHQAHFLRSTDHLSFGEGADNAFEGNVHTVENVQSDFLNQQSLDGDISVSFGHSVRSPIETSHAPTFEAVNDTGATQSSRELEQNSATDALGHADVGLNVNQNQRLALSMSTPSNAAHLMNAFQLESIMNDINAAQLMRDFHLEPFSISNHANAAQLMQQSDLITGYYDLQNL